MSSHPYHIPRRASSPATSSTLSASPPSSDQINAACIEDEDADLLQSSQSSQSSRIVSVAQNDTHGQTLLVISKIELIFETMVDILADGGEALSIPYRGRDSPQQPLASLRFPGKTVNEATKFSKSSPQIHLTLSGHMLMLVASPAVARMMRIMDLCRDALMSGRIITKRSIYYQDPELFKSQTIVDHLVDDLACTLGVGRNALNIVAASKGLIAGSLRLIMADGSIVSCSSEQDNNDLIPPTGNIHQVDFASTKWILVIEKEATFRTLAASQYWRNGAHGHGIIVTGKGYPDLATLEFLNLVHTLRPLIPMLCVVDCDPHGIDIMRMYKHGSKGLGHEANARVPGLQWLGVKMDDILLHAHKPETDVGISRGFVRQLSQSSRDHFSQDPDNFGLLGPASQSNKQARALMALTLADRKTANRIFQTMLAGREDEGQEFDQEELEQLRELQVMLMLNMKAEIQAIDKMGDLSDWLDEKMNMA